MNTTIHDPADHWHRTLEEAEAAYRAVIEDGMDQFYASVRSWQLDTPRVKRAAWQEYARLTTLALDAFNQVTDAAGWPQDR